MPPTTKKPFHDQLRKRLKGKVSKSSTGSRKNDGVCLQAEILSRVRETKIGSKGTIKYSFQVLLDYDPTKLKLPMGTTLKDDGSITVQAFSTKKELDLPKIPYDIQNYHMVWMESFRKPEGDVRVGALLNLYNVEVTYWHSDTKDKDMFSFNTHTSVVVPADEEQLLRRYRALPPKMSHFTIPKDLEGPYYPPPCIIPIRNPTDEDMSRDTGFVAPPPSDESVENARFSLDIEGETRAIFDHNYVCSQWTPDNLAPMGFFNATMWGYSDRGDTLGDAFGVTDPVMWVAIGPKLVQGSEGVIVGYVDKNRTLEMDVNGQFHDVVEGEPEWGVRVKVLRFISDARRNIKNVCYEVTPQFVDKVMFKGETNAQSPFAQRNPWNDGVNTGLINMNEMIGDRKRLYTNKGVKFWFLCEADITEEERTELIGMTTVGRSACFGTVGKKKDRPPFSFRWKSGIVFAELPPTGKRKRSA